VDEFFPLRHWNSVQASAVQDFLRDLFTQWGLPQALRLDNGLPWASSNLMPAPLSLWVAGFGIQLLFNPPHQPKSNAIVERDHSILARWTELPTCPDLAQAQTRLDQAIVRQRSAFPYRALPSRLSAYPRLTQPCQCYCPDTEPQLWHCQALLDYLATLHLIRRVDSQGRISLLDTDYSVGRAYGNTLGHVQLDPQLSHWIVRDDQGYVLKSCPAPLNVYAYLTS
jgi:hypothetical protein